MSGGNYAGLKMMDWYVPSYIGLVIASIGTSGCRSPLDLPRARRAAPLSAPQACRSGLCLGSQFLVGVGTCLIGATAISVLGVFAYGVVAAGLDRRGSPSASWSACSPSPALGVLIASLAPTARAAQGVGLPIWFIMLFVSGTSAPLDRAAALDGGPGQVRCRSTTW